MDEKEIGELPEEPSQAKDLIDKTYFENLSNDELVRMADHYGMDIPPDLDRIFIIEQLLDILDYESEHAEEAEGTSLDKADFPDQAPLPKQYNITFIEVLIRDPLWAFVFWELRAAEKESLEAAPDFEGYFLKISSCKADNKLKKESVVTFTVSVGINDNAWYLGFPPDDEFRESGKESTYWVDLCAQKGGEEITLVSSAVFSMPPLLPKKHDYRKYITADSPISLSGIDTFAIVRNEDRESRTKNHKGAARG